MQDNTKIVLLIGAPSTGKTSVLNHLNRKGFNCFDEISREVVQEARRNGYDHLFKDEPLLFSEKLLEGRVEQFLSAKKTNAEFVFIDRGLPDITAYLDMVNTSYPIDFEMANQNYRYDFIFWFPVWRDIHIADEERYENFELSQKIESYLINSYQNLKYDLIEVPKLNIESRVKFLLSYLK
jgi:predicted ATPase